MQEPGFAFRSCDFDQGRTGGWPSGKNSNYVRNDRLNPKSRLLVMQRTRLGPAGKPLSPLAGPHHLEGTLVGDAAKLGVPAKLRRQCRPALAPRGLDPGLCAVASRASADY